MSIIIRKTCKTVQSFSDNYIGEHYTEADN